MTRIQLLMVVVATLVISSLAQTAQAHPYVSFGIRLGGPYYYGRPYYYGYPYYYPYAPGPIIYQPAPAIIVGSAPAVVETVPAPSIITVPAAPTAAPKPLVVPTQNVAPARVDSLLAQLSDPTETVRRDAAMDLGRMKAQQGIDPLLTLLAKDSSPLVRDAAARALGLIGSSRGLNGLIYAAQADNDRDVRHSAQFAIEVIRANLRGN